MRTSRQKPRSSDAKNRPADARQPCRSRAIQMPERVPERDQRDRVDDDLRDALAVI